MRLKNLSKVYIYEPRKELVSGEYQTQWLYKGSEWINPQQDINELDRNTAGYVDTEIVKLRTDKMFDINKNDGISFTELKLDENGFATISKPFYIVEGNPKIGKTTTYSLKLYH